MSLFQGKNNKYLQKFNTHLHINRRKKKEEKRVKFDLSCRFNELKMTFKSSPWLSSIQFIAHIHTYSDILVQMNKRDYSHFSIWYHTANCWLVHSQFWFRSERMRENNVYTIHSFLFFYFIKKQNSMMIFSHRQTYLTSHKTIEYICIYIYISVLNFYIQWQWRVNQRQTYILIILCFRVNFNESLYIDVS